MYNSLPEVMNVIIRIFVALPCAALAKQNYWRVCRHFALRATVTLFTASARFLACCAQRDIMLKCCSGHTVFTFSSGNNYFSYEILVEFFPTFLTNKFNLKSKSTLPLIHLSIFYILLTRAANNSYLKTLRITLRKQCLNRRLIWNN